MSHELRTPLNSILILGQQLSENPMATWCRSRSSSPAPFMAPGTDLLNLISDILDLSKIESGTVTVDAQEVLLSNLVEATARPFRHEADNRQLVFDVEIDQNLGRTITTDSKRLQQVLKNLLSNAFKFTEPGLGAAQGFGGCGRLVAGSRLAQSVGGGGVRGGRLRHRHSAGEAAHHLRGVPAGRRQHQPEIRRHRARPRHQRELANLLGGEIQLRSVPGKGSTFTLYVPLKYVGPSLAVRVAPDAPALVEKSSEFALPAERAAEPIADDRLDIAPGDSILLIVEDDPHYARVIMDLARDHGFKVLIAMRGVDALDLAKQFQPTAVSLDVFLPDMLGWTVLNQLKQNPLTRHIPVQIITLD
jgi:hypothetical protein